MMDAFLDWDNEPIAIVADMSTSIQTGPPIGVQKEPMFVIGKKHPESDAPLLSGSGLQSQQPV